MTLDEAIKFHEESANREAENAEWFDLGDDSSEMFREKYEKCRECAEEHRQLAEWLRELKRDREILNGLSIYFQSLVLDAVINQTPLVFNMRDATEEERESVKQYITDSAKMTGINFWWNIIGGGKR